MYKIVFVAPSDHLKDRLVQIFEEYGRHERELGSDQAEECVFQVCVVEQPMDIFKQDIEADVLVARGFMARQLQGNPQGIPVVHLPVLGNELVFTFDQVRKKYGDRQIGVIGADNMIMDAERLGAVLGLKTKTYLRFQPDAPAAESLVRQAAADGCEVIVSGFNTCEYARSIGLDAVMIESGHYSLVLAIKEARRAVDIMRTEQEKALRIKAILDYAYEGIIAVNSAGKVTMMNGQAGKLLGIRPGSVIGISFDEAVSDSPFKKAVHSADTYVNEIMAYRHIILSVNKVPLVDHGENVGHVLTFQDITKIQEAEGKIRNKIYSLGHVARFTFDDVIGTSSRIRETIEAARRFAGVNSNILMIGETGTGKELFAQSIHNASERRAGPFVAINCAALPENLLESELFGYVEGAFTGAAKSGKPGLFELAHRGTIFLDEISDLPSKLQGRLLRVLQERSIMRLGHDRIISVDVRIIAATNRDLGKLAAAGEFRDDLFFRLNVLKLELPPLRDRPEDIRVLANHFIRQYAFSFSRGDLVLDADAADLLEQLPWRGNVRELQNVCERLAVLSDGSPIGPKEVLSSVSDRRQQESVAIDLQVRNLPDPVKTTDHSETLRDELGDLERKRIEEALTRFNGNKVLTARHLGISRTTLWRRRKELGLEEEDEAGS